MPLHEEAQVQRGIVLEAVLHPAVAWLVVEELLGAPVDVILGGKPEPRGPEQSRPGDERVAPCMEQEMGRQSGIRGRDGHRPEMLLRMEQAMEDRIRKRALDVRSGISVLPLGPTPSVTSPLTVVSKAGFPTGDADFAGGPSPEDLLPERWGIVLPAHDQAFPLGTTLEADRLCSGEYFTKRIQDARPINLEVQVEAMLTQHTVDYFLQQHFSQWLD
jgi:hypothetical protein